MKKKSKRLEFSFEVRKKIPREPNHKTEVKWKPSKATFLRFVDDGFSMSMVNFENSFGFNVNGVFHRVKHAIQSQNIFRHLIRRAERIGMKVNTGKISMMCMSDVSAYEADAYLLDSNDTRIGCQSEMKILGMRFSNKPTMSAHFNWI